MPRKSRSRGGAGAPAAKRSKSQWSRSPFGEMMEEAGMHLGGDRSNELSIEPSMFQRRLTVSFKSNTNLDKAVHDFCEGLSEYCDEPDRFRMALLPTKAAQGVNIIVRSSGLDSLIRLLLGVDCLQSSVITTLLDKLPAYMTENHSVMDAQSFQQMPHLILNQLRMLDHLVQGKELCAKLMEVVSVATPEIQTEIVSALPHIVDDPQHDDAAVQLKSLLSTTPSLTAAIMDALSNLIIANHIAEEVLDVALDRIQSADLADLPTIIKFVMQHVTPKNAQEIVTELRGKLDLDISPLHSNIVSSTPRDTQLAAKRVSAEISDHFVIFDTICSTIRIQKCAADGWMKAIESVTEPDDHRVIDVFVLFILYSIGGRKKAVETVFMSKIRTWCFSDDLISAVFGSHAKALTEYFTSILVLCDTLLCSTSPSVSSFAASLYQYLFSAFDITYQQEVIGALITHINNGTSSEMDHALNVLLTLVDRHFKTMQRFSILIKGVLDRLEYLNTPQIRKLYDILSTLGFTDPEKESAIQDEMRILIRKQLLHSEQKYRHMGVIGAVMVVRQLARADQHLHSSMSSQIMTTQGSLPDSRKKLATSMLDDVMKTCSLSVESMILFSEEMSAVVGSLDAEVLSHLSEQVTSSFQDDFLIEVTDSLPADASLPMELLFGLDGVEEEGSIALNILPLVMGVGEAAKGEGVRGMAARFHLLQKCEHATNSNLEGIDALLGCPVVLCSEDKLSADVLEDVPLQKRQDICLSLFHCLNWFRELVCAFSGETDPDMKGKVILRLTNITHLQDLLEKAMTATPGWWPPAVNAKEPTSKGRKGKGGKNEVTLASITAATVNIDKNSTVVDKSSGPTPAVPIDRLKPYFRELDLGIFKTLGFGTLSRTFLDSEMHTKQRDELKLHPPQALFLLDDLYTKISSTFSLFGIKTKSGQNGGSSFTADELVKTMVTVVPLLCGHLESTNAFFQTQLEDNDGIIDMACSHQDYSHHCLCFHLLLKSLSTFFGWSSLSDPHYSEQLDSCMESLASRLQQTRSGPNLPQMAANGFKYLERFVDVLPTITCAHSLSKLFVALCKTCKANHIKGPIGNICGDLLRRTWKLNESTSLRKEAVEYLLKYHVEWASEPLTIIEVITGEAAVELIGENAVEESTKYQTLTKSTFSWYYRVMISTLVHQVKAIPVVKKTDPPTPEVLEDRLHVLEVSARVLFLLVNLVKSFYKSAVLSACMKYGRAYVDAFLRSGMPILDNLFRTRKDDVIALLKNLQQSTRWLQHYCGHSKVVKDTNLINHVPQMKKSLELFIFKVKELMTNHNCAEAFWVGNLKNRDIKGREILSQQQNNEDENEENEEESGDDGHSVTNSTSTDRTTGPGEEPMDYDQVED